MTDDAIMEEFYEALGKIPRMREPEDARKRTAFLLAHEMINKARECVEKIYQNKPETKA